MVIEEDTTRTKRTIELRGSWIDTRCTKGAFVHVIGEFDSSGNCVIDDVHGMIILHPDHLISAGVVADSFGCLRRAVLQDRIKATSEASPPLVYGTMLHELFQEALTANRWDDVWMKSAVQGIIEKHIEDLYAIQVDVTQAIDHFESKVAALQAWADKFVRIEPGVSMLKSPSRVISSNRDTSARCNSQRSERQQHTDEHQQATRCRGAHLVPHVWTKGKHGCDCPGLHARR